MVVLIRCTVDCSNSQLPRCFLIISNWLKTNVVDPKIMYFIIL